MDEKTLKCFLCGKELDGVLDSNNPFPLREWDDEDARCCSECNGDVMKARGAWNGICDEIKPTKDELPRIHHVWLAGYLAGYY